jgi:hypothetical protein
MVGPMVSVSHEALPVRLTGGVFTPIDPATPTPPVFVLGVSGNFDFASGKKK